ncbi:MAG: site-specific DNA-methyltransferase [Bacteroidia bacterium]|nr:site-specific DNA-methyltransferase [Bacteroidia bacterium]
MEKLTQETVNFTEKNIDRIAALFPSAITETKDADGKLKQAVNFDQLKQLLSNEVVDGDECYEFTWVGKKQSIIEGNRPIRKTLRPCKEESKNWDTTENLYIEGDNLDVLKLLQNSYLNKVKMIYIDPPYNTGNDFVYRDNFKFSKEDYEEELGLFDEEENRLFKNTETNGRYHSDWCSMMYPRLQLARNLLTDVGVIFISIDDNEVHNLRKICDEVFGEENFVANLIWTNKEGGGSSDSKMFRLKHEYILCYSRNIDYIEITGIPVGNEDRYKLVDEYLETRGKYYLQKLGMGSIQYSESLDYPIEAPDGTRITPIDNNKGRKACWRWSKSKYEWGLVNGYIVIQKDRDDSWTVYSKQYLNCDNEGNIITRTQRPMGVIDEFSSTQASKLLYNMGLGDQFNYSKPIELIKYLIKRLPNNDIILDFFSGSATTAHAVMQLNAEDGGNRKFIMVQLPEETDPNSEAYKAGYKNICEIGKERIRRAGKKIEEELNAKSKEGELFKEEEHRTPDTGFRVLKVDSTNMKDVYYSPSEYNQQMLLDLESNIKEDRTDIDLLYGVLLDWGVPLSLPHITEKIGGKDVHFVNDADLVACFEEHVPEEVIREIARRKPLRVVFRDSSFRNSPDKINVTEIFKTLSPETTIKVI